MPGRDLGVEVKGIRLPGGVLELTFSKTMGYRSWLCTIRKESGEPVEDARFLCEPAIRAPWLYRVFVGLGELNPLLRVADRKGNSIWFYHGWDRHQRERIYLYASSARGMATYELLVDRESFASMLTQLREMTGLPA